MFFKSNSVLIGFDSNAFNGNIKDFHFLNFIQSANLNFTAKRLAQKSVGQSSSIVNQYEKPDITLNLSYLQRVDFFNEFLFGLNIVSNSNSTSPISSKFEQGFLNQNAFLLFSEDNDDLLFKIKNKDYSSSISSLALGRVYLDSYSIQYSVGNLPEVSVSFLASQSKISKLRQGRDFNAPVNNAITYGFDNWDNSFFPISYLKAEEMFNNTNISKNKNIVYHMRNFSMSNTYKQNNSTIAPGIDISTFFDGTIKSLDLNLNFNRNKFNFFEVPFEDRKFIYPIKGSLKISGLSQKLVDGDLSSFFTNDRRFNTTLGIGENLINSDYYELNIQNIAINSFSFTVDLNGMLNYTIDASFEITKDGGLYIKQVNKKSDSIINISSNENGFLTSNDGQQITLNTYVQPLDYPVITNVFPPSKKVILNCGECCYTYVDACMSDNSAISYVWRCNGVELPPSYYSQYFEAGKCIIELTGNSSRMGYYDVVIKNIQNNAIISPLIEVIVAGCPIFTQSPDSLYSINDNSSYSFYAQAMGVEPLVYEWVKTSYPTGVVATGNLFTINNFQTGDTGNYTVKVNTSGCNCVTSCNFILQQVAQLCTYPIYSFFPSLPCSPIYDGCAILVTSLSPSGSGEYYGKPDAANVYYQWRKDSIPLVDTSLKIKGSKSHQLSIYKLKQCDAGYYDVIVTSGNSFKTLDSYYLQVCSPALISGYSQDLCQKINIGEPILFKTYTQNVDELCYCWQYSKDGYNYITLNEENKSFYYSAFSSLNKAGYYKAIACNSLGSSCVLYNLSIVSCPIINFQPLSDCVVYKSSIDLSTSACGTQPIYYDWYFSNSGTENFKIISSGNLNGNLTINNFSETNTGYYYSIVRNCVLPNGVKTNCSILTLLPLQAELISSPADSVSIYSGSYALFCYLMNYPFEICLLKNNSIIYNSNSGTYCSINCSSSFYMKSICTFAYQIFNSNYCHAGNYTLCIKNSQADINKTTCLLIKDPVPKILSTFPDNKQSVLSIGENINFSINSEAAPLYGYTWIKSGSTGILSTGNSLCLTGIQGCQSGYYKAVVANSYGFACADFLLNVVEVPVMKNNLQQTYAFDQFSSSGFLEVVTAGCAPLTYKWYKDGNDLTLINWYDAYLTGKNTSKLCFCSMDSGLNGNYCLKVLNPYGQAISSTGYIYSIVPAGPLFIDFSPRCITGKFSTTVTLTGNVNGNYAKTYQWKLNDVSINGATGSSYTTPALSTQSGRYTLSVNSIYGSVCSLPNYYTDLVIDNSLSILNQPSGSINISEGSNTSIYVNAIGPNLGFCWEKDGSAINYNNNNTAFTCCLCLIGAQTANNGNYRVKVYDKLNQSSFIYSNISTLTVYKLLSITCQSPANINSLTLQENSSTQLSVVVAPNNQATYQWYKAPINTNSYSAIVGATSDTYVISSAKSVDEARYRLVATNKYISDNTITGAYLDLSVIVGPKNPIISVPDFPDCKPYYNPGAILLNASVSEGCFPLRFQWICNGSLVASSTVSSLTNQYSLNGVTTNPVNIKIAVSGNGTSTVESAITTLTPVNRASFTKINFTIYPYDKNGNPVANVGPYIYPLNNNINSPSSTVDVFNTLLLQTGYRIYNSFMMQIDASTNILSDNFCFYEIVNGNCISINNSQSCQLFYKMDANPRTFFASGFFNGKDSITSTRLTITPTNQIYPDVGVLITSLDNKTVVKNTADPNTSNNNSSTWSFVDGQNVKISINAFGPSDKFTVSASFTKDGSSNAIAIPFEGNINTITLASDVLPTIIIPNATIENSGKYIFTITSNNVTPVTTIYTLIFKVSRSLYLELIDPNFNFGASKTAGGIYAQSFTAVVGNQVFFKFKPSVIGDAKFSVVNKVCKNSIPSVLASIDYLSNNIVQNNNFTINSDNSLVYSVGNINASKSGEYFISGTGSYISAPLFSNYSTINVIDQISLSNFDISGYYNLTTNIYSYNSNDQDITIPLTTTGLAICFIPFIPKRLDGKSIPVCVCLYKQIGSTCQSIVGYQIAENAASNLCKINIASSNTNYYTSSCTGSYFLYICPTNQTDLENGFSCYTSCKFNLKISANFSAKGLIYQTLPIPVKDITADYSVACKALLNGNSYKLCISANVIGGTNIANQTFNYSFYKFNSVGQPVPLAAQVVPSEFGFIASIPIGGTYCGYVYSSIDTSTATNIEFKTINIYQTPSVSINDGSVFLPATFIGSTQTNPIVFGEDALGIKGNGSAVKYFCYFYRGIDDLQTSANTISFYSGCSTGPDIPLSFADKKFKLCQEGIVNISTGTNGTFSFKCTKIQVSGLCIEDMGWFYAKISDQWGNSVNSCKIYFCTTGLASFVQTVDTTNPSYIWPEVALTGTVPKYSLEQAQAYDNQPCVGIARLLPNATLYERQTGFFDVYVRSNPIPTITASYRCNGGIPIALPVTTKPVNSNGFITGATFSILAAATKTGCYDISLTIKNANTPAITSSGFRVTYLKEGPQILTGNPASVYTMTCKCIVGINDDVIVNLTASGALPFFTNWYKADKNTIVNLAVNPNFTLDETTKINGLYGSGISGLNFKAQGNDVGVYYLKLANSNFCTQIAEGVSPNVGNYIEYPIIGLNVTGAPILQTTLTGLDSNNQIYGYDMNGFIEMPVYNGIFNITNKNSIFYKIIGSPVCTFQITCCYEGIFDRGSTTGKTVWPDGFLYNTNGNITGFNIVSDTITLGNILNGSVPCYDANKYDDTWKFYTTFGVVYSRQNGTCVTGTITCCFKYCYKASATTNCIPYWMGGCASSTSNLFSTKGIGSGFCCTGYKLYGNPTCFAVYCIFLIGAGGGGSKFSTFSRAGGAGASVSSVITVPQNTCINMSIFLGQGGKGNTDSIRNSPSLSFNGIKSIDSFSVADLDIGYAGMGGPIQSCMFANPEMNYSGEQITKFRACFNDIKNSTILAGNSAYPQCQITIGNSNLSPDGRFIYSWKDMYQNPKERMCCFLVFICENASPSITRCNMCNVGASTSNYYYCKYYAPFTTNSNTTILSTQAVPANFITSITGFKVPVSPTTPFSYCYTKEAIISGCFKFNGDANWYPTPVCKYYFTPFGNPPLTAGGNGGGASAVVFTCLGQNVANSILIAGGGGGAISASAILSPLYKTGTMINMNLGSENPVIIYSTTDITSGTVSAIPSGYYGCGLCSAFYPFLKGSESEMRFGGGGGLSAFNGLTETYSYDGGFAGITTGSGISTYYFSQQCYLNEGSILGKIIYSNLEYVGRGGNSLDPKRIYINPIDGCDGGIIIYKKS